MSLGDNIDIERALKLHQEYVNIIRWLEANKNHIFHDVKAVNIDYAAICESPPEKIHFFRNKRELIQFLKKNIQAGYIYRYADKLNL